MKLNKLFVTLAGLAILFSACNKEPQDVSPSMSLSKTELSFTETASSQPVTVTSNRDWKVSGTLPDWVQVSPGEGLAGEVTVTVAVLANDGYDRRADIVFNGGTQAKQTLIVNQKGSAKGTTIEDLKDMLTEKENILPAGITIVGKVVSNRALNDLTSKKSMFIQDETAGINLFFEANHEFDFGDVLSVDVSGLKISKYYEQYQVSGIPLANASRLSTGTVEPIEVEVKDFVANKYEGMYVTIKQDCQVAEADLNKTWVMNDAHTNITIVAKTGETFVVRSSSYSTFGALTVPQGSGKISGISTIYNDGIQLVFAQNSDYAGLTNDRFEIQTQEITSEKISVILQASQGAKVTLKNATVVATAITNPTTTKNNTFLVTDSEKKDFLLVYDTQVPGIAVGDNVTVSGSLSSYSAAVGNNLQIAGAAVTIHSHGAYDQPSAEDITATFDSFDPKTKVKLISFKGTYAPNGTYCNVNIAGATKIGSFLTPDGIDVSGFEGIPNVKYTGYYLYQTSSKYIYIILTKAEPSSDPYLSVSQTSFNVSADTESVTFDINANVPWTCQAETDGYTVNPTSGSGNGTVVVSFAKNTDISKTKVGSVKVSSEVGDKTVTITQAKASDPSATVMELTNGEIVAAVKKAVDGGANGYVAVDIESTSGAWSGYMNAQKAKDGSLSTPFVQLRGKNASQLTSPTFAKNVSKIEFVLSADKNAGQTRDFYVVPVGTTLPADKEYTNDTVATNYGTATSTGVPGETVTIEFTSETKNFMLIVKKSATYIDSIKVYLK